MVSKALDPTTHETDLISQKFAEAFADAPDVLRIYLSPEGPVYRAMIILSLQTYNHDVMNALLDREYALRQSLAGIQLDTLYPPLLDRDFADIVPESFKLIYGQ